MLYTTGTISSVKNVEVIIPPITACPIGFLNSEPSPKEKATGIMPKFHEKLVSAGIHLPSEIFDEMVDVGGV